jgi:phosphatidyl-myo-inositol alpha-mannosyltransferase
MSAKRLEPMKILLVSPFDFGHAGGVNEHIRQLDRQFVAMGHSTRILAATSPDVGEVDDGHVYRLGASVSVPANGSMARITLSPFIGGKVKQFLMAEKFDVIHLHEPLAPMLNLLVLLHSQTVNIGTFHAARSSDLKYMYIKAILDIFFDKLDARITVSEAARDLIDAYFPAKFDVIPNGIALERYDPHTEPLPEFLDGRKNILFVGRFDESRKGFRFLLRALPMVRGQYPDARLIVVGRGDPAPYQRYLSQQGIDDAVFAGVVSEDMLPRYYASADVFCAPSTGGESFGIVLLEALASGSPVVATAIPGYSGVIRNGRDGVLVEPKDERALAIGLVRVLADNELRDRLRTSGLQHVQQFSWRRVAEQVLAVYERARSEAAAGPSAREWPSALAGRR